MFSMLLHNPNGLLQSKWFLNLMIRFRNKVKDTHTQWHTSTGILQTGCYTKKRDNFLFVLRHGPKTYKQTADNNRPTFSKVRSAPLEIVRFEEVSFLVKLYIYIYIHQSHKIFSASQLNKAKISYASRHLLPRHITCYFLLW